MTDRVKTLAAATAKLLLPMQVHEKKNEERDPGADAGKADDKRSNEQRAYVDQRLRDLAEFERRVSGNKRSGSR